MEMVHLFPAPYPVEWSRQGEETLDCKSQPMRSETVTLGGEKWRKDRHTDTSIEKLRWTVCTLMLEGFADFPCVRFLGLWHGQLTSNDIFIQNHTHSGPHSLPTCIKTTYANGILFVPNYHVKLCQGEVCLNVNHCDLFSNKSWDLLSLTQTVFP